ncbi:MAG: hypothetical protein AABW83_03975 [Nanoarchaeota archaeon]
MKAVIGYLLAGIGLIGLALNSKIGRANFNFLEKINSEYILIPVAVLIVLGVVIMIMNSKAGSKIKQINNEVPIYQGEGKKRKIVGYRVQ